MNCNEYLPIFLHNFHVLFTFYVKCSIIDFGILYSIYQRHYDFGSLQCKYTIMKGEKNYLFL